MSGPRTAGSLRGRMPRVAAFVDALRAVGWGPDVDAALRNAKAGGIEFGARPAAAGASFSADQLLAASVVRQAKG